jgi:hypothetical protein
VYRNNILIIRAIIQIPEFVSSFFLHDDDVYGDGARAILEDDEH